MWSFQRIEVYKDRVQCFTPYAVAGSLLCSYTAEIVTSGDQHPCGDADALMDVIVLFVFAFANPAATLCKDANQPRGDFHIRFVSIRADRGEGVDPFLRRATCVKLALFSFCRDADFLLLLSRSDASKKPRLVISAAWGGAGGQNTLFDNVLRNRFV